jgi:uncharacterized protein (DUF1499 family)
MKLILALLVVSGLIALLPGCRPPEIGLVDGGLRPCPDSPNCVVSQGSEKEHGIAPIAYRFSKAEAREKIRRIVTQQKGATIIEDDGNYLHAEFKSKIMRFVDDVEFLFPENEKVIHMRSASRVGYSDLGVNRKRAEHIRALFFGETPPGQEERTPER